ncbi:hypothetical protein KUCAC02_022962, partial [Chaenocephalus aceratus]
SVNTDYLADETRVYINFYPAYPQGACEFRQGSEVRVTCIRGRGFAQRHFSRPLHPAASPLLRLSVSWRPPGRLRLLAGAASQRAAPPPAHCRDEALKGICLCLHGSSALPQKKCNGTWQRAHTEYLSAGHLVNSTLAYCAHIQGRAALQA